MRWRKPVVRDGEDRAPVGEQGAFQPVEGGGVEVVGGLVEEHDLGCRGDQTGDPQPGLLASGEAAEPPVVAQPRQAQGVQCPVDAGIGFVSAAQLEDGEQIAVLLQTGGSGPVELALQRPEPALHLPEVRQSGVDRVLDGAVRRQVRGLTEVADAAVGPEDHLAFVGPLGACEDAQQRRLPGAVLPHDPDALAGAYRQGDAVEQQAVAVGLGDVVQGNLSGQSSPRGKCNPRCITMMMADGTR
ncbi:hypothetical protein YWIDRAFT_05567 [Streptomyces sp. SceaMP-e96]|nr:hypothetical protein YWIDRAFT_05567 [Streptomyces sp. SceaMP-e96]